MRLKFLRTPGVKPGTPQRRDAAGNPVHYLEGHEYDVPDDEAKKFVADKVAEEVAATPVRATPAAADTAPADAKTFNKNPRDGK